MYGLMPSTQCPEDDFGPVCFSSRPYLKAHVREAHGQREGPALLVCLVTFFHMHLLSCCSLMLLTACAHRILLPPGGSSVRGVRGLGHLEICKSTFRRRIVE